MAVPGDVLLGYDVGRSNQHDAGSCRSKGDCHTADCALTSLQSLCADLTAITVMMSSLQSLCAALTAITVVMSSDE